MSSGALDKFCDGISMHVQEEIDATLSAAKEKAERKIKQADKQAKVLADKMVESAKTRALKLKEQKKSEYASALRKEELKLQGKVRNHIFTEIENKISLLGDDSKKYKKILFKLALEAVLMFKEEKVELIANARDKDKIDAAFLKEVQDSAEKSGVKTKITLAEKTHEASGIILKAGNVLWENTLERRLEIFSDDIDSIIISEIFEKMRS